MPTLVKISGIPTTATDLVGAYLEISQGGVTKKAPGSIIEPAFAVGTNLQFFRGDKSWQTLDTSVVPENGNLYYTASRFNTAFSGKSTTDLAEGTNLYYTSARFNSAFSGKTTSDLTEGTNLYFTEPRVLATQLSGLSITGSVITATDTVLQAFGKLQNQVTALLGGVSYQGGWNASTNSPALASGVGTKGYYYIVTTAGSTNLDGITDWKVGDWAIYGGSAWQKVDNTDAVVSVNGQTGIVSLSTSDVSEGTNLYYTNARGIGSTLTGYTSGAGAISSSDTILSAIQKLNGNDALAWKVTGTTNLTGNVTIAGGSNVFAFTSSPAAGTATAFQFSSTLTGGASSGDVLVGVDYNMTYTGTLTGDDQILARYRNAGTNSVQIWSNSIVSFGSATGYAYIATASNTGSGSNSGKVFYFRNRGGWGAADNDIGFLFHTRAVSGAFNVVSYQYSTPSGEDSWASNTGTKTYTWQGHYPTWNLTGGNHTLRIWDYNPTETSLTGLTYYGLTIGGTNALNGFNTRTPALTVDVAGGFGFRQTTKTQITGNQNDYAIGSQSSFLMSSDASRNVTGLTGGSDGKHIEIFNTGAQNIVFTHQDGASVAANRFLFSTGGNITVLPNGSISLRYDSTAQRWRDIAAR